MASFLTFHFQFSFHNSIPILAFLIGASTTEASFEDISCSDDSNTVGVNWMVIFFALRWFSGIWWSPFNLSAGILGFERSHAHGWHAVPCTSNLSHACIVMRTVGEDSQVAIFRILKTMDTHQQEFKQSPAALHVYLPLPARKEYIPHPCTSISK
jgi:hypothetical protein